MRADATDGICSELLQGRPYTKSEKYRSSPSFPYARGESRSRSERASFLRSQKVMATKKKATKRKAAKKSTKKKAAKKRTTKRKKR